MERAADMERPSGPRIALKTRRTGAGFTRQELALRVGLTKSALAGIENGHHAPGLDVAMRIADTLGASVADIFDFHECACGCSELTAKRFVSGHNCRQPDHGLAVTRGHQERRRRLGIVEEKVCERCASTFTRSDFPRLNDESWSQRRYCSADCRWPIRVQERPCRYCDEMFRPDDNSPTRLFCSRRCAQKNRVIEVIRDGKKLVADAFIEHMPGKPRRIVKLKLTRSPGRPGKWHPGTRQLVQKLRDEGRSWNQIEAETGLPKSTVRSMYAVTQKRS